MKTLFILNDPPYGTERSYNGLRLAVSLAKTQAEEVRLFLMGDAAACAKRGQKVPQGYYNVADMLGMVARRGARRWFRARAAEPGRSNRMARRQDANHHGPGAPRDLEPRSGPLHTRLSG